MNLTCLFKVIHSFSSFLESPCLWFLIPGSGALLKPGHVNVLSFSFYLWWDQKTETLKPNIDVGRETAIQEEWKWPALPAYSTNHALWPLPRLHSRKQQLPCTCHFGSTPAIIVNIDANCIPAMTFIESNAIIIKFLCLMLLLLSCTRCHDTSSFPKRGREWVVLKSLPRFFFSIISALDMVPYTCRLY